jgi:ethanolamine utilization protein EutN
MQLGKIVGCVWATEKNPGLMAQRLLIVQPLTPELVETGKKVICTDATGAGAGELVYWCKGKEASFPFLPTEVPTDATVVGIVDKLTVRRGHRNE